MTENQIIANNLKAEIKRKGLTSEDVANKIGISRSSFSGRLNRFARGKGIIFGFFQQTAEVLEIPVSNFFKK